MSIGTALLIARDAIDYLIRQNILHLDGTFSASTLAGDVAFAAAVEASAKSRGVTVRADVDRVIQALPSIIALLGL